MAAYEVLLLNTAVPQIQAAQSGDTYVVPRDIAFSAALTLSAGTANGVPYLNASKVLTTGSALTFDGTNLAVGSATAFGNKLYVAGNINSSGQIRADIPTAGTSFILTGTGSNFQVSHATSGFATLLNSGGGFIFSPDGSEQMRLTSTGLGIGTSSPTDKLDVLGGKIRHTLAGGGVQLVLGNSLNAVSLGSVQAGGDASLAFYTNTSTERMRLDSFGNLGLGVTPSAWGGGFITMDIGSSTSLLNLGDQTRLYNNGYVDAGGTTRYKNTAAATLYITAGGGHNWYNAPSGTAGNAITFTQAMTLDASGNLGVGTGSPQAKLDVANGNVFITQDYEVQWKAGAVTRAAIRGTSGDNLSFYTRVGGVVTETMRLDASGNLGLGVTPSAWASAIRALDISAGALAASSATTQISHNAFFDGTFKYKANGFAAEYRVNQGNGSHAWYNAPSGTAGNAVTFTQAMTLDANGNLGVGTASPGDKLTVAAGRIRLDQDYQIVWQNAGTNRARILGDASSNLIFETGSSNTERARITSGGSFFLGVQAEGGDANGVTLNSSTGYQVVQHANGTGSGTRYVYFYYNAGEIGSITQNGTTAVAYNTTSDYRLKENPQPLTGSGAFIDALQPKTWSWKVDGSKGVGFIAHEAQAVSPSSVVGEKDAVDADGKPIMQAMEYGSAEFIANIIAELQSLRARVAQLEGN